MTDIQPSKALTLQGAQRVLDAALDRAVTMGAAFCLTVTDPAGEPIVTARMDGAPWLSAGIAANKAFTAAGLGGMATGGLWDAIKDEPALVHGITNTPRLIVFGGGVGIFAEEELVGAIGVSGGSVDQDTEVAAAGAAAVG